MRAGATFRIFKKHPLGIVAIVFWVIASAIDLWDMFWCILGFQFLEAVMDLMVVVALICYILTPLIATGINKENPVKLTKILFVIFASVSILFDGIYLISSLLTGYFPTYLYWITLACDVALTLFTVLGVTTTLKDVTSLDEFLEPEVYAGGVPTGQQPLMAMSGATATTTIHSQPTMTAPTPMAPQKIESRHSRTVALLLCFFFGILGIHQFYVGKSGMGILYFCTYGVLGFGVLLDLIFILVGSFTDSEGLPVSNWNGGQGQPSAVVVTQTHYTPAAPLPPQQPQGYTTNSYEQPALEKPTTYCPNCGAKNEAVNTFCSTCGSALTTE